MYLIKNENVEHWLQHNIRITELKDTGSIMSQPGSAKKLIHLPRVRMLSRGRPGSGIRITNVKSIKPPDPEMVKKHEEDRLRAQLHKEIEEKSRLCANKQYECTLPVLAGRRHCARHILQEPGAPYRRCAHAFSSGDRCPLPAPVPTQTHERRDQGLCFEHARAALLSRQRSQAPPPPVASTETYLNQLQHYVKPERTRTTSCASSVSVVSDPGEQDAGVPHAVDPFKQIDAIVVNASVTTNLMECNSASESDADSVTLGRAGDCRGGAEEDLSEGEETEVTKAHGHAGIFTAEEAVCEAKDALKQLQSAYVRQMGRLRTLLHAARYDYVKALKAEKEQYCSINSQARSGPVTARERRQLRKLKAFASYHRRHGAAAVAQRRLHRKRAKALEPATAPPRPLPSAARCTFAEGGVRCPGAALPAARHCGRHVVHDTQQVLFVPCGDCRGGVPCREPVARLPLPSSACRYHTSPPAHTSFSLKKEDSASNTETESASDYSANEAERSFEERAVGAVPVTQPDAAQCDAAEAETL